MHPRDQGLANYKTIQKLKATPNEQRLEIHLFTHTDAFLF